MIGGKKILVFTFGIFLLVGTLGFASAANPQGILQIFRNATTGANVTTFDNNGNIYTLGNINISGIYYGNGAGLTNINSSAINSSQINYWLKNGNNIYYNSGNVGIGTNNPLYPLEINQQSTNNGLGLDYNSTLNSQIHVDNVGDLVIGSTSHQIKLVDNTNNYTLGIFSGPTKKINFAANGDSYFNGGNVGIGTSNPSTPLEVSGTALINAGYLKIINSGDTVYYNSNGINAYGAAYELKGQEGLLLDTKNNASIQISPDGTGNTYITNGNVGIGTTSPISGLDVENGINGAISSLSSTPSGSAWIGASGTNAGINIGQDGGNYGYIQSRNKAATGASYPLVLNPLGSSVGIGTNSPLVNTALTVSGDSTENGLGTGQLIISGSNNSNQRLNLGYDTANNFGFIEAGISGSGYKNLALEPHGGNIGIGTTTPGYKLDVAGNVNAYNLLVNGTAITPGANVSGTGTTNYIPKFTSGTTVGNSAIYQNGSNVGIGTTNPHYGLEVQGSTGVFSQRGFSVVSDGQGTYYGGLAPAYGLGYGGSSFSVGGNNNIVTLGGYYGISFLTQAGSPRLSIDKSGNVGIGTTNPSFPLEVQGSSGVVAYFNGTASPGALVDIGSSHSTDAAVRFHGSSQWTEGVDTSNNAFVIGQFNNYPKSASNSSKYVTVKATTGNVGIGTTNPSAKLDVNGSAQITGDVVIKI